MKGEKQKTEGNCPRKNSSESKRYERASTLIGIVGDELVEVQLSSDRMLEYILTPDNLNRSYKQVKANKRSSGIHKMGVEELLPYMGDHKEELTESLLSGRLLSNIILTDLDRELEKRGLPFVRYADDCIFFCKSPIAAERVCESITKFIEGKLFLKVNREKIHIGEARGQKFLG